MINGISNKKEFDNLTPIVIFYGYEVDQNIFRFIVNSKFIEIKDNNRLLKLILKSCDGYIKISEIKKICGKDKNFDFIINFLFEKGIILHSHQLYKKFIDDASNPLNFPITENTRKGMFVKKYKRNSVKPLKNTNLNKILQNRQSTRDFSGDEISLKDIKGMLASMFQIKNIKTVPSAGSFYGVGASVIILKDRAKVKKGIYSYIPTKGELKFEEDIILEKVISCMNTDIISKASLIIFIYGNAENISINYSNKSWRHILLESGHIAQNAYLTCAEKGWGIVEWAGFFDKKCKDALSLAQNEYLTTSLIIGMPDNNKNVQSNNEREKVYEFFHKNKIIKSSVTQDLSIGTKSLGYYMTTTLLKSSDELREVGIGFTTEISKIKAFSESFERYSLLKNDFKVYKNPKKGAEVFDYNDLYSNLEFKNVKKIDDWVVGKSMVNNKEVFAPSGSVVFNNKSKEYKTSTNGCASHFELNEAIKNAFFELIERDALMLTWFFKIKPNLITRKHLPSIVAENIDMWNKRKVNVLILDISIDSIPVVLAVMYKKYKKQYIVSFGMNADIEYKDSILGAYLEAESRFVNRFLSMENEKNLDSIKPSKNVKTVLDHEKYYFDEKNFKNLNWLISGNNTKLRVSKKHSFKSLLDKFQPCYFLLHNKTKDMPLYVVRVKSKNLMPVVFGWDEKTKEYVINHKRATSFYKGEFNNLPHFFS